MESAAPEQRAGELDETLVVLRLLVVADEDRAALGQPGECALDDPAPGGLGLLPPAVELLLADAADVGDVPGGRASGLPGRVVVGLVQAQVLGDLGGVGALDHGRVEGRLQQLGVVDVGALDLDSERAA